MVLRFEIVHNIPSPYRIDMFRLLAERVVARGVDFHVHFMATGHHDRPHWQLQAHDYGFSHTFWRDRGPVWRGDHYHLNLGLALYLLRSPPNFLLVGGPWDTPTGILASLAGLRAESVAWIEGNASSPGRILGPWGLYKRALLRFYGHIAVPGKDGRGYLKLLDAREAVRKRTVVLPNVVDETRFRHIRAEDTRAMRAKLGVGERDRLAIWNARLIARKGIVDFLSRLQSEDLAGWQVRIFGEGPERERVQGAIFERGLSSHVGLQPYLPYEQMPALYGAADLLLLPSLSDPNPLSVVEALHAGVAVLVSSAIGNANEAVAEGLTGWTLDPNDSASVRAGIHAAFRRSRAELGAMATACRERADAYWNSRRRLDSFLQSIGVGEAACENERVGLVAGSGRGSSTVLRSPEG